MVNIANGGGEGTRKLEESSEMANTCPHGQVSSHKGQVLFLTCFDALAIVQK
jgi:hypothetical protein